MASRSGALDGIFHLQAANGRLIMMEKQKNNDVNFGFIM